MSLLLKSMGTGSRCCLLAGPASGLLTGACGRLAQRSLPQRTHNAANNSRTPDATGGSVGIYPEIDTLRFLVENKASDHTLATFLRSTRAEEIAGYREKIARLEVDYRYREKSEKMADYREKIARLEGDYLEKMADYREKTARLEGDIKVLTVRMKYTMAAYLKLLGLFSMRGVMEYIQSTMPDCTKTTWKSWQAYVDEQPTLQACLAKHQSSRLLYIGPPLVLRQRELMACLCDDIIVPYKLVEAVVGYGDGD